ncbi:MAG: IS1634 family transposase [Bacteroidota bacterium]
MFIKRTTKRVGSKTYINHLLVESVITPKGPRHNVVCSLGSLAPAPPAEWLSIAHRIDHSLRGQSELIPDEQLKAVVERVEQPRLPRTPVGRISDLVEIHTDQIEFDDIREAGSVHVGHQMWKRLGLFDILAQAGLSERARMLTEAMTLNRLVFPLSEHAMPNWMRRTAMADILGESFDTLADDALYRNLDRLHPQRVQIEKGLNDKEQMLFNLEENIYLYDLTSSYFEGQCVENPQAKRGYSRDKRPDCKQIVVGLVLGIEGFPKAHEIYEGNRQDRKTVDDILDALELRVGRKKGATVVVDRGMAYDENLKSIKDRDYHYIVAARQSERNEHLKEFEMEDGWTEILREPSPRNPHQKKSRVYVRRKDAGDEAHYLCRSDGRKEKDKAIREKHEARLLVDLKKLSKRVTQGTLSDEKKIHEAIGRMKERYPRVARYFEIAFNAETKSLHWDEKKDHKAIAERLDGAWLLKTDRKDLSEDEVWRTYILLTRVESAFRSMKGPLAERPIFHRLQRRVQTHVFLCVLAYHLLVAIEKTFLDAGIHTSWETLREELSTHQVITVSLQVGNGSTLNVRKGSRPEPRHLEIYQTLKIPSEVMKPIKTWTSMNIGTDKKTKSHEIRGKP